MDGWKTFQGRLGNFSGEIFVKLQESTKQCPIDAVSNISPFKYGVILGIYVKFQGWYSMYTYSLEPVNVL